MIDPQFNVGKLIITLQVIIEMKRKPVGLSTRVVGCILVTLAT